MTASVLVIDDEYGVRSGIGQILQMEGYEVREAATGRAALDALAERRYDVALIDYRLPDIDGLTLLGAIRAAGGDTMTCMITAYANIDTAIAATRQGIDFFLPKPFSPEDLLGVVETLVRHRRLRDEAAELRRAHEASLLALADEQGQTRSLVGAMRDAVLVVNRDGLVVLVNHAMAALLGRPAEEVTRRPAAEVLTAPAHAALRERLAAADRSVGEIELGERAYMVSVVPFTTEAGAGRGTILTLSDITAVRRTALDRARFVRTMVHELRAPLAAVRSIIEVALERSLGPEVAAYAPLLERGDARIGRLVELIADLLSLSRIDAAPAAAPAPAVTAVAPLVTEALDGARDTAAATGVTLAAEVAADLPPAHLGGDDLRLVLANLVGNAVKYNRPGGRVTVRAAHTGGRLVLEVEDTGIGIKAESLPRVFDEFFREKRPETRELEGNGLGLAIVRRVVERAFGTIEARSVLGAGSTVVVRLP